MGSRRASGTGADRWIQRFLALERQARLDRVRRKGHTLSPTFVVGGAFDDTVVIPKMRVGLDHDGETPEWKRLTGFEADLITGTATIEWSLNGSTVATQNISTTAASVDLDDPIDLAHGDRIEVAVDTASGASGLSATVYMIAAAR